MSYWLHRINKYPSVEYPLLDAGYLSIGGFSEFCDKTFLEKLITETDVGYFNEYFDEQWGPGVYPHGRYNLWRFIVEMQKGDWVVIPLFDGEFSIVEILEDSPLLATDETVNLPKANWEGLNIIRDTKTNFIKCENMEDYLDIGFLRKVTIISSNISRADFADSALTAMMKYRGQSIRIDHLGDSITKAYNSSKSNKPINLKNELISNMVDICSETILSNLNPNKYEYLVRWYFKKIGANDVNIPPKNYSDKQGDVDIIATFENLKTIVYVQVKFYTGETNTWAIEQIKDFSESKDALVADYTSQFWVISSSEMYSDAARNLARENKIRLIDGKEFCRMLLEIGVSSLENFEYQ